MSKYDQYRARARECQQMANNAWNAEDRRAWLQLTESWLRMIPVLEDHWSSEEFGAVEREREAPGYGTLGLRTKVLGLARSAVPRPPQLVSVPESARPRSPRTHAPINEPARNTPPGGYSYWPRPGTSRTLQRCSIGWGLRYTSIPQVGEKWLAVVAASDSRRGHDSRWLS
jgi:hypothetical protein